MSSSSKVSTAVNLENESAVERPSVEDAREAVRTLLRWTGDNPDREGLIDTPDRVVRAYQEWFSGYDEDPVEIL